jgi:MFS family permease
MTAATAETPTRSLWKVIFASSAGTLIEWYDFYIFGSLATILATQFFPKGNPTLALLSTLATFATGFLVRPFGAVFFGRMGDMVGRKVTFLVTLLTMGLSTFCIGLVPTYASIGFLAPLIVLVLRLLQGLAIGGEYGGAATYVCEHSPPKRRGFYTSFIQTTATLGLFVSLLVILGTRSAVGEPRFAADGWRIPFLLSIVLVLFSYAVRRRMEESPLFAEIKAKGQTSRQPITDSLKDPANRRLIMIALFGAMMGQGVVWYTGQFYSLYFIQTVLNFQGRAATEIVAIALLAVTPFYILFGSLSDRIGRKTLIVTGCLMGALFIWPIYAGMLRVGTVNSSGPPLVKIESKLDAKTGKLTTTSTSTVTADNGATVTTKTIQGSKEKPKIEVAPTAGMFWGLVILVFVQALIACWTYAPIASFLVELFPTRIRYTSLSIPYHLGNGIFGGLLPLIGTAMVDATGNKLAGTIFPVVVAFSCFVVGARFIHEKRSPEGYEELT